MAKGTIFVVSKIFMAHQLIVVQCADDHCAGRMVVRTNKDSESIGYGVKVGKRRWRLRNLSRK